MRAAVLEDRRRLVVKEVAEPVPAADEVVVQVAACGVCGTDRAIYNGDYSVRYPLIMGHELSGTVVACGEHVQSCKPGDRVTVEPNIVDDDCYFCRHGVDHLCTALSPVGISRAGGFAQFVAAPARYAYVLPDDMSDDVGAQVEPVACCVHGIDRAEIAVGDLVVVFGCGPIGCILIQLARLSGATPIVAVDPNPARRLLAERSGADVACGPADVETELRSLRAGAGPDVVIEASGSLAAVSSALSAVRRGGTALLFAVYPESASINVSPFRINEDELRIVGSLNNPHTHQRAIDLLSAGRIEIGHLITDVVALSDIASTMELDNFPTSGKILIKPGP